MGYAEQVHHHAPPRKPAPWPHQVGVIPPRALSFQHRAEADQLRAAVGTAGTAVLSQVLAGTGGVGKTQLAADFARTAWGNGSVDVLVWISASSRQAITAGYAQAGAEVLAVDPSDPEQAARAFLAWLEPKHGQRPCRWLIVLDDLADPADLHGLWPPSNHGRTLVTTRRRDAALTGHGRRLVHVGLFMPWEAAAYLTSTLATHNRTEPAGEISALAEDLGYLPLALAQAAAYLIDSAISCAEYRRLLADRLRKLADLAPSVLPDDQEATVAAAWSLSIERADRLRPAGLARPMLQLVAMLDPNGIPAEVLTSQPVLSHLTRYRTSGAAQSAETTVKDAKDALTALGRLSLIDQTPDIPHQSVRAHGLIQRATRDTFTPAQHHEFTRTAADALIAAWPDIDRDIALGQAMRANTSSLTAYGGDALYQPYTHPVLHRVGQSLGEAGEVSAARDHFHHLADATSHRGPVAPEALVARIGHGSFEGLAGDPRGAADALAELVADMEEALGSDAPDTLIARINLAVWRGESGDPRGAAEALTALLPDLARVLGPDAPFTLVARSNLARYRGSAGEGDAAAALAALLPDLTRVLGPDAPFTLGVRNDLAVSQGEAGDPGGAADRLAELVPDLQRVLGPANPPTLLARRNLALWQGRAGDAVGAAGALAELIPDLTQVLGPDHPETFAARTDLASFLGEAGNPGAAARALAELLPEIQRVLGPTHPHTLLARRNLALWQGRSGGRDPS